MRGDKIVFVREGYLKPKPLPRTGFPLKKVDRTFEMRGRRDVTLDERARAGPELPVELLCRGVPCRLVDLQNRHLNHTQDRALQRCLELAFPARCPENVYVPGTFAEKTRANGQTNVIEWTLHQFKGSTIKRTL